MTFPSQVNTVQALAVAGDRASANVVYSALAGAGAYVAAAAGATVGTFVWQDATGTTLSSGGNSGGPNVPVGFLGRDMSGMITTFLAEGSQIVPAGFQVTAFTSGDFWAVNKSGSSVGVAAVGVQKIYASYADGTVAKVAVTGSAPTNAGITANLTSGSAVMTVTANSGANVAVGQPVSGTGIPAGTYVLSLGTGTGGAGTYTLSANASATNSGVTVTATTAYETKWYAGSTALNNELLKVTTRAIG